MGNFHSGEFSFPETFVPENIRSSELSLLGPFIPGNFLDLSFRGTFVPKTFRSQELSFPQPFYKALTTNCRQL